MWSAWSRSCDHNKHIWLDVLRQWVVCGLVTAARTLPVTVFAVEKARSLLHRPPTTAALIKEKRSAELGSTTSCISYTRDRSASASQWFPPPIHPQLSLRSWRSVSRFPRRNPRKFEGGDARSRRRFYASAYTIGSTVAGFQARYKHASYRGIVCPERPACLM